MKKLNIIFQSFLIYLTLNSCQIDTENKVPPYEELYAFPFKTEVDALNITNDQSYIEAEKCGDDIKRMVRNEVSPLSSKDLIQLGKKIHREQILTSYNLTNHARASWLTEILTKMKPYLVENSYPYDIYIFESRAFNAFTIPGGNLYFSAGLLDAVRNPDELAFIVGHELGHNENDHTKENARLYVYLQQIQNKGIFVLIQGILTKWLSSACGKSDELESDIASIYLLNQAGYDVEKSIGAIELLKRYGSPKTDNFWDQLWWGLFGTHPWSEDREKCVKDYLKESKVKIECETIFEDKIGVVVTKSSPLNIRLYPMQRSEKIAQIPKGTAIEVICDCVQQEWKDGRDWLYVAYLTNNTEYRGWVNKAYVDY